MLKISLLSIFRKSVATQVTSVVLMCDKTKYKQIKLNFILSLHTTKQKKQQQIMQYAE